MKYFVLWFHLRIIWVVFPDANNPLPSQGPCKSSFAKLPPNRECAHPITLNRDSSNFWHKAKHCKNCESCPTQVTWKIKFKWSYLSVLSVLSDVCPVCAVLGANVRDMEELLLGSSFYCYQIRGKSRTADSDQMAPFYTRQTWTRNIVGILPVNILGFTHDIPEASLRKQWSGVENMRTTFTLDDVHHIHLVRWSSQSPQPGEWHRT